MSSPYTRVIVVSDPLPIAQQEQFVAWLKQEGVGWNHWITGGWLLSVMPNQVDATAIRDNFTRMAPNTQVFVINVDKPDQWAAWYKNENIEQAKAWLRSQWGMNPG
jgi:hypothetical protein